MEAVQVTIIEWPVEFLKETVVIITSVTHSGV